LLALASTVAQRIQELHIDVALEQLDATWRPRIIHLLTRGCEGLAQTRIVADNHLSSPEIDQFAETVSLQRGSRPEAQGPFAIDIGAFGELLSPRPSERIALDHMSFTYDRRSGPVLRDVNVELEPGRLYVLTGANGSGKTTLVKLLSGTLTPRHGSIRYGACAFRPKKSYFRFASSAFQNPDYQWTRTSVSAQLGQARLPKFTSLTAAETLAVFGLPSSFEARQPIDLPFVFKKRLGIAITLMEDKPWAIFDEPTLGQDRDFAQSLAASFRIALQAGRGILLISHDDWFKSQFPDAQVLHLADSTVSTSSLPTDGLKNKK
jgi:energy-coupling factor transport system ATP-binding protein